MMERQVPRPGRDGFCLAMAAVCLVGLGGFLVWAGLVPLEQGIAAHGTVVVENDRQVVQHLEGGIIRELRVREGDHVRAGEPLLILEETASLASRDQVAQEIGALRATVARLDALQSGAAAPDFAVLDGLELGEAEREDILERETNLFEQQRDALDADLDVLRSKLDGARTTRRRRAEQIEIGARTLTAARDELGLMREMFDRQMARRDAVTTAEREVGRLESEQARLRSELDAAEALARELESQIAQARARFAQDLSSERLEARQELLAAEEQLQAAQDVLERAVIVAPVSGEVLNLAFSTRGGVVRPGEPILEIVPAADNLVASVRVRPADRAAVHEGQTVRTQISAYRSWRAPRLEGEVVDVSADLKTDQDNGAVYYEARIRIPPEEVAAAEELDVRPGMPVEAFIFSGVQRTTLDYLLEPLTESIFRGLRSS